MEIDIKKESAPVMGPENLLSAKLEMRLFLKYAGVGSEGVLLIGAGCKVRKISLTGLDLGRECFGILTMHLNSWRQPFTKVAENFYPSAMSYCQMPILGRIYRENNLTDLNIGSQSADTYEDRSIRE